MGVTGTVNGAHTPLKYPITRDVGTHMLEPHASGLMAIELDHFRGIYWGNQNHEEERLPGVEPGSGSVPGRPWIDDHVHYNCDTAVCNL